jgi:hypothetical protein
MYKSVIFLAPLLGLLLSGCGEEAEPQGVIESPAGHRGAPASQPSAQPETAAGSDEQAQEPGQAEIAKAEPAEAAESVIHKGIIMGQGTVRYIKLEGGFWGIITDNGQKILPKNLPKEYRKDGLRLSFEAREIKGMMTIQQWGTLSSLSNIEVIGQVESKDPHI